MRYNPKKHRLPIFEQSGILLVDKPKEWTSHDVVNFVRWQFNIPKVGHCGTLDPAATGLLVLVLGKFTKLSEKFSGEDKSYKAQMLLGTETDSQDMDGEITAENDFSAINDEMILTVMDTFRGEQQQIPPMVSARKQNGERLYKLAKKGIEVEREPKDINISELNVDKINIPYVDFTVRCSKGTYIRTLCSDIGAKLGCGAVLHSLIRTRSGEFEIEDAVSIETLKEWGQSELQDSLAHTIHQQIARNPNLTGF